MTSVDARASYQLPVSDEVEDFTDQVDEACRLIAGLQTGDVSLDEFDRREAARLRQADANRAREQPQASSQPEIDPERKRQLKYKIAELQDNLRKKEAARQRYATHVSQQSKLHTTDYTKWDLFTPDDEEDDLINSLTPNNPQMKAMEADIDARHARMVSQRQLAERQRVAGNALYSQGQFTAAFQCYETGLDAERHNMALHSNAAQVLIKMGCYVQAIEHCDKELKHYSEASKDLQLALELEPNNKAFVKELDELKLDVAEHRKQRAVLRQLAGSNSGSVSLPAEEAAHQQSAEQPSSDTASAEPLVRFMEMITELRSAAGRIDKMSANLVKGPSGLAGKGLPAPMLQGSRQWDRLAERITCVCGLMFPELHARDDCRVCLREHAGIDALCALLTKDIVSSAYPAVLQSLTAACHNDYNCKAAAKQGAVGLAAMLLSSGCRHTVHAAAQLLYTLTTQTESRLAVGQALTTTAGPHEASAVDQLFKLLTISDPDTKAVVLSLLSNTATLPQVLQAASTSTRPDGQPAVVTVTEMLSGNKFDFRVKAATLLGNLCHDSSIRAQVASNRAAVASLLAVLSRYASKLQLHNPPLEANPPTNSATQQHRVPQANSDTDASRIDARPSNPALVSRLHADSNARSDGDSSAGRDAALAAATALQNLLLDKVAQVMVCNLQGIAIVSKLLVPTDWLLAARAAGILARLAHQPTAHAQMLKTGALDRLLHLLSASYSADIAGDDAAWSGQVQDSASRLMAIITSAFPPAVMHIGAGVGVCLMLQLLRADGSSSTALGNASLCIGELAKQPQLLPILSRHDAVAPLLGVAYRCKGTTQKNAAIAVARLAHDKACMQRVRDLHGLDIIYQYVKP